MGHALCVAQYTWSSLKWHLPSGVGPLPPPLMAQISIYFLPHFFSFAIESYIYETDFTLSVKNRFFMSSYKDPPSSLQISSKIRYQETKPNGRLRRSTGIAIHCEYQPNQISEPCNQGPI